MILWILQTTRNIFLWWKPLTHLSGRDLANMCSNYLTSAQNMIWGYIDETMVLGQTFGMRLFGQCHNISMIRSCMVRVILYDKRNSPVTVLTYICITQDTFIDIVMSWYDHHCADANTPTISYLPCWSYILSTIAFIMWKSFVCKFVLLMLNVFI